MGRGIVFDAVEIVSMTAEQLHLLERDLRSFEFRPRRNPDLNGGAVGFDSIPVPVGYR